MDVTIGTDRRRLVFWFVFAPLLVVILAGLVAPGWFDQVLLVVFPATAVILCAKQGMPWCFAGAMGKAVLYFWIAVTSLQWLGYGIAAVSGLRSNRLRATVVLLMSIHLVLLGVAALAMRAWYSEG